MRYKNNYPNVEELRNDGYKVRVSHRRVYFLADGTIQLCHRKIAEQIGINAICNRGGVTVVEITAPDGSMFVGEARCHENDNFNRKRGLAIAVGRALQKPPVNVNMEVNVDISYADVVF